MLCSISGVAPNEPVFSAKSGHVFEKRLIVKHLKATNTCPVTNETLSEVDLIPVKGNPNIAPRSSSGSSLPTMIQTFQNEWDALMLESFSLKKHLSTVQQVCGRVGSWARVRVFVWRGGGVRVVCVWACV